MKAIPFYLIDLFFAILCVLIMKKYMDIFFTLKKRNSLQLFLWFLYCFMQFIFKLEKIIHPPMILIINILLVMLICTVSCVSEWKKRCIFSMLICTFWMLVEIITGSILNQFGFQSVQAGLPGTVISEMCMFLFAVLVSHWSHKHGNWEIPLRYAIIILLIPVMSIYLIHNIFRISNQYGEYTAFAIISSFSLLVANYIIFEIYDWVIQNAETKEKNRMYEQQLDLCSKQAYERELLNLELRRTRHDMQHHLATLLGMANEHNSEQAVAYIADLLNSIAAYNTEDVSRSGNIAIDSLVNYKCTLASKENISFIANVFIPDSLPFRIGDLTVIFGNLLDNALEACREIKNGERFIELEASYGKKVLILTVRNPYEGKRCRNRDGSFRTTKQDSVIHGLGLFSIEQALKPYHGELQTDDKNGVFQATAVMYGDFE